MSKDELSRLYNAYVDAMKAAYPVESDFYRDKAKSPELKQKAKDAYKAFDDYREKLKKQGKL